MAAPLADVAHHPLLHEINTWPWLEAIRAREGRSVDLGSVPDRYWDEIADLGFDAVCHGWCSNGGGCWLVVVNLSDNMAAGLIHAPWEDLGRRTWN